MKFLRILGLFTLALTITHCTKKTETATDATATTADAAAAKPAEVKCSDGSAPEILNGTCKGAWSTIVQDGKDLCLFTWGPKVSCPEGSTAMGYQEVCYGVSTHDLQSKGKASIEDCSKKFGETPSKADYSLVCCKK